MNSKLTCTIPSSHLSYDIHIQTGILNDKKLLSQYLSSLGSRFAIITDGTLSLLYGEQLYQSLVDSNLDVTLFSFPSGETYKTRATKEHLENQMFEKGFGRDTCVIALGGGVVTDLAGYLAATYCRGVPLVTIPTSLLGMIDASIGGKTSVNVPYGKNMLGCIYQPKKVIIDPSTLQTLPAKEFTYGVVEMIKHSLIADSTYFDYLDKQTHALLNLEPTPLEHAIFESCRIKKEIVEQDEKEQGKRHLLNFGHTIAHALENLTHYTLPHGEAVAIGLLVESHLAVQLGHLSQGTFDRIHKILIKYGLPLQLSSHFSIQALSDAMVLDKKSLKGQPRFVIINAIGSPLNCNSHYCMHVEEKLLKNALQWMNDDLCCH